MSEIIPTPPVVPVVAPVVTDAGHAAAVGATDALSSGHAAAAALHGPRMGWGARRRAGIAKTITAAEKANWRPSADLAPKPVVKPPVIDPAGVPVTPAQQAQIEEQNRLRREFG